MSSSAWSKLSQTMSTNSPLEVEKKRNWRPKISFEANGDVHHFHSHSIGNTQSGDHAGCNGAWEM